MRSKRREFFDNFANSKKFDPLDGERWYTIGHEAVIKAGGKGVLNHSGGSHIKAIIDLYPEINWKKEKFFKYRAGSKSKRKIEIS